ncbi:hypothetical protein ACN47E_001905 [Coniothyrium glycines]
MSTPSMAHHFPSQQVYITTIRYASAPPTDIHSNPVLLRILVISQIDLRFIAHLRPNAIAEAACSNRKDNKNSTSSVPWFGNQQHILSGTLRRRLRWRLWLSQRLVARADRLSQQYT